MTDLDAAPKDIAKQIAAALHETEAHPFKQIVRIVEVLGAEQAWAFVRQAEEIEAQGGMFLKSQERRRTLGGVFFALVRGNISYKQRKTIWPQMMSKKDRRAKEQAQAAGILGAEAETFDASAPAAWADRRALLDELRANAGTATTCKLTLVARPPARVVEKPGYAFMLLRSCPPPSLPRGLPVPPTERSEFTVYMANKVWNTVRPHLINPDDAAVLSGPLVYDPDLEGLSLLCQEGSTLAVDAAKRGQELKVPPTPRQAGQIGSLKGVVVGRPGKVLQFSGAFLTMLTVTRVPALPKGLPAAPTTPTQILVLIGAKQWAKVEKSLRNQSDTLVADGFAVLDPDLPGIALFATQATTKLMQQAKRESL